MRNDIIIIKNHAIFIYGRTTIAIGSQTSRLSGRIILRSDPSSRISYLSLAESGPLTKSRWHCLAVDDRTRLLQATELNMVVNE